MIGKEHLRALKRISKIFEMPVQLNGFAVKDTASISMIVFEPKIKSIEDEHRYNLSVLPDCFIQKKNDVTYKEDSLVVNGRVIIPPSGAVECSYARGYYKPPIPNIEWEKHRPYSFQIDGRELKELPSTVNGFESTIRFIVDSDSARMEFSSPSDWHKDRCWKSPAVAYRIGVGSETERSSRISVGFLTKYKSLIPSAPVTVTFGEDILVMLEWKDSEGNGFTILVAPRIDA